MSAVKLYKQRCVDVLINATTGAINFPNQMDLENAYIVGLEVFTVNDMAVSAQNFQTLMPLADMKNCYVTLYDGSQQVAYRIPLLNFHRMRSTSSTDPSTFDMFQLDFVQISWTKCQIEIGSTLSAAGNYITFSVYYLKADDVRGLLSKDVLFEKVRAELMGA